MLKALTPKRKAYRLTMRMLMLFFTLVTFALVVVLMGYILYRGVPGISWKLVSTSPSYLKESIRSATWRSFYPSLNESSHSKTPNYLDFPPHTTKPAFPQDGFHCINWR